MLVTIRMLQLLPAMHAHLARQIMTLFTTWGLQNMLDDLLFLLQQLPVSGAMLGILPQSGPTRVWWQAPPTPVM